MLIWLLLAAFSAKTTANGLHRDVYHEIAVPPGAICYRILNGTHQFGCHTSKSEGTGVVVKIEKPSEISGLETCWRDVFVDYNDKYFLMLDMSLLIPNVIAKIRASNCIKGLILTDKTQFTIDYSEPGLSQDSTCPSYDAGFYKDGCEKNAWNKEFATLPYGIRQVDWDMQIVYISNRTSIETIEKCYKMYNRPANGTTQVNYPYCSALFSSFSTAAGNSEICRRRSTSGGQLIDMSIEGRGALCDEIAGHNVVAFVPPRPNPKNDKSNPSDAKYLMLATRIDSFGLIPEISPAEISVMTSLISLLATARSIGEKYELFEGAANKSKKHLMFAFFNGESFDYIGSSSMMYMAQNGKFPVESSDKETGLEQILPSQIVAVVETQHVGSSRNLNAIVDADDHKTDGTKALVKQLQDGAKRFNGSINDAKPNGKMPPSSWHSLKKVNRDAVGVVIAPFEGSSYKYDRINSMVDRNTWTDEKRKEVESQIGVAAAAMLEAAADHVGLDPKEKIKLDINKALIKALFDCLVIEEDIYACPFIKNMNVTRGSSPMKSTYVGASVQSNPDPNPLRMFTYLASIYTTGTTSHTVNIHDMKTCQDLNKPQYVYNYQWMQDPMNESNRHCYRHSVFSFDARSPAFIIEDYDFTNRTYSTWTESVYNVEDGLKLFLVQKRAFEWIILSIGIVLLAISYLIVGRCHEETFIVDEGERSAEMGEPL